MGRHYEFDFKGDAIQAISAFSELVFATRQDDMYLEELVAWAFAGNKGPEPVYVGHVHNTTDMLRENGHKLPEILRLREAAYCLLDDMKVKGEL